MGKKEKLIKRLKSNPKRFLLLKKCRAYLIRFGFEMYNKGKTSGSRVKFLKGNIAIILHKPHPRKELLEYQIKQILEILEKEELI